MVAAFRLQPADAERYARLRLRMLNDAPWAYMATPDTARGWPGVDWIDLGVSARSPEAQRLYESLGFVAWGREPESTQIGDQRHDEIFMALRLGR